MDKKQLTVGVAALGTLAAAVYFLDKRIQYPAASQPNPHAPATTDQTVDIAAEPERVWQVLSDIDQWPRWQSDIPAAHLTGPLQAGSSFDWQTGGLTIHSTLHTVQPQAGLGWSGKSFGAFAVHNWTLTPQADGTRVRVQESMEGWLVQLLQFYFRRNLPTSIAVWLNNLKKAAETPAKGSAQLAPSA